MKKILFIISTIALSSTSSSCSDKVRDVQYYIDHPEKREKVIKDCDNNPGEKAGSANCVNAIAAHNKVTPLKMPSVRSKLDDYLDDYVDTLR